MQRLRSRSNGSARSTSMPFAGWRTTFRLAPPPAFARDLLVRFITRHLQEQAYGGLGSAVAKLLDDLAQVGNPTLTPARACGPAPAGAGISGRAAYHHRSPRRIPRARDHMPASPPLPARSPGHPGTARASSACGSRGRSAPERQSQKQHARNGGPASPGRSGRRGQTRGAAMTSPERKLFRCAIYTRKSDRT